MDERLLISLDKLPIRRLDAIEDSGVERYPPDIGYYEKRVSLIRRIDFAWASETEEDNAEKERKKKQKKSSKEPSAASQWHGMVDNLHLAHQELSVIIDLINTHLGKYFKQSAKALEQQIARRARFFCAMIRLSINLPPSSCCSLHFGFFGVHSTENTKRQMGVRTHTSVDDPIRGTEKESKTDDEYVKETHFLLCEAHQAIFDEQSSGVNVTGIRENYLPLSIGQGSSLFISLVPYTRDDQTVENVDAQNAESSFAPVESSDNVKLGEGKHSNLRKKWGFPNHICFETYLQLIVHKHAFIRAKERPNPAAPRVLGQLSNDKTSVLHSVGGVPYLHMMTHPTWDSRTSSWTLFVKTPQSILDVGSQSRTSHICNTNHSIKSQFLTTVVVNDNHINVEGDGAPNIVGLFKTNSADIYSVKKYDCDVADLPVIILQEVAGQVIRWLLEEALMAGVKVNRDFLRLTFELEQGETISLVAHVDPDDTEGCISWWLVMDDGFTKERRLGMEIDDGPLDYRKFLGHLSLDVLHSTLMDLVSLCGEGGSH